MKTRVSLKYFANNCLWKQCFASVSPPDALKLDFFDSFGNSNALHTV